MQFNEYIKRKPGDRWNVYMKYSCCVHTCSLPVQSDSCQSQAYGKCIAKEFQ
jgi:hypothetical protein